MLPTTSIFETKDTRYLLFNRPDLISHYLIEQGSWENHITDLSSILISQTESGVILDIGSNIGTYTIPLAKRFPSHNFVSFEIQRIIYYQFCANIILNSLDNVVAHNFGLSNYEGEIYLTIPDYSFEQNVGAFSIDEKTRNNNYEIQTVGPEELMFVTTLDSIDIRDIRLIKIDVEGAELEVLEGALETLALNNYPPIIFETWTSKEWYQEKRKSVFELLESIGYHISEIGDDNLAQHTSHGILKINIEK